MFNGKRNFRMAFTLVEVIATTVVLCIIAIGSLNFQYYAARDSKISRSQITATRTAQLLLEDWMSTGGSDDYNPAELGLGFTPVQDSPPDLGKYSELGTKLRDTLFINKVDEVQMLVMLMSKDVAYDEAAKVKLRQLSVYISYGIVYVDNAIQKAEAANIKPVILTTYIRVDASGG
jgi:hypothetical protein